MYLKSLKRKKEEIKNGDLDGCIHNLPAKATIHVFELLQILLHSLHMAELIGYIEE